MLTSLFACAFNLFPPTNYMFPQYIQTAIIHLIFSIRAEKIKLNYCCSRCLKFLVILFCQFSIYYLWRCVCKAVFRVCTINVRQYHIYYENNNCKLITSHNCCKQNLNTFYRQSDNNNEIKC